MKNTAFRKATALLLALAMLMACMPALAKENAGSGEDKKIEGSVIEITVAPDDATAVHVSATGSGDASMTVTEGVSALANPNGSGDSASATGALVEAGSENTAALNVSESITAETCADISGAYGARVDADVNSTAVLNAEKIDAAAHGRLSSAEGLGLYSDFQGTIKAETGGISAIAEGESAPAAGVCIEDREGCKTEVAVGEGGITATATGKEGSASAVDAGISGDAVLTSKGDITAKAADNAAGVDLTVYDGASASVSIERKLSAKTEAENSIAAAADLNTEGSGSITLKAVSITAEAIAGYSMATAADLEAGVNGSIKLNAEVITAETHGDISGAFGARVEADVNSTTALSAGKIEAAAHGELSSAEGLGLFSDFQGTIKAEAGGISAMADGESAPVTGVHIEDREGCKTEVAVGEGGITAKAMAKEGSAIAVDAGISGDAVLTSKSDITAASTNEKGGSAYAVSANINDGGSLTLQADGCLQATAKGEDSDAAAVSAELQDGKAGITVDQDVTAAGGGKATGIAAETYNASAASISIGGNVTAKDAQKAFAIDVSGTSGTIGVSTVGEISAVSCGFAAVGIHTWSGNEEDITVDAQGSVSASASALEDGHGYAAGIQAFADHNGDKITITVGDGVSAETEGNPDMATGIFTRSGDEFEKGESGTIEIQVIGDVESSGTGIQVTGTERDYMLKTTAVDESEYDHSEYEMVEGTGICEKKIYYHAEGDYYYDESGNMWQLPEDTWSGLTRVEVRGDVNAGNVGLDVSGEVPANVIIDGTLQGEKHAVVLSQESVEDNLTLTVWEIRPNEDGSVAEYGWIDQNGDLQTAEADMVEQRVQYIIRLEQPEAGGMISTNGTFDYEGYTVAHESDNVVLKIDLQPGYEILDAFNGTETKVSLLQNEDGEYYLVVPRGGAVLLSVKLGMSETPLLSVMSGNSETETRGQTNTARQVTITMDPNGGTLNGSTKPLLVRAAQGQSINLPEAPEKAGSTFLGWYGTPYAADSPSWKAPEAGSDELLKAGSTVRVTCDYFYTAVWSAE